MNLSSITHLPTIENLPVPRNVRLRGPLPAPPEDLNNVDENQQYRSDVETELFYDNSCIDLLDCLDENECLMAPVLHECVFPISKKLQNNTNNTNNNNTNTTSRGCNPDSARLWLATLLFLHSHRFRLAWWINASSSMSMETSILDLLDALDPSGCSSVISRSGPLAVSVLSTFAELHEKSVTAAPSYSSRSSAADREHQRSRSIVFILDRVTKNDHEETVVHFLAKHAPRWNCHVIVIHDEKFRKGAKVFQLSTTTLSGNKKFTLPRPHLYSSPTRMFTRRKSSNKRRHDQDLETSSSARDSSSSSSSSNSTSSNSNSSSNSSSSSLSLDEDAFFAEDKDENKTDTDDDTNSDEARDRRQERELIKKTKQHQQQQQGSSSSGPENNNDDGSFNSSSSVAPEDIFLLESNRESSRFAKWIANCTPSSDENSSTKKYEFSSHHHKSSGKYSTGFDLGSDHLDPNANKGSAVLELMKAGIHVGENQRERAEKALAESRALETLQRLCGNSVILQSALLKIKDKLTDENSTKELLSVFLDRNPTATNKVFGDDDDTPASAGFGTFRRKSAANNKNARRGSLFASAAAAFGSSSASNENNNNNSWASRIREQQEHIAAKKSKKTFLRVVPGFAVTRFGRRKSISTLKRADSSTSSKFASSTRRMSSSLHHHRNEEEDGENVFSSSMNKNNRGRSPTLVDDEDDEYNKDESPNSRRSASNSRRPTLVLRQGSVAGLMRHKGSIFSDSSMFSKTFSMSSDGSGGRNNNNNNNITQQRRATTMLLADDDDLERELREHQALRGVVSPNNVQKKIENDQQMADLKEAEQDHCHQEQKRLFDSVEARIRFENYSRFFDEDSTAALCSIACDQSLCQLPENCALALFMCITLPPVFPACLFPRDVVCSWLDIGLWIQMGDMIWVPEEVICGLNSLVGCADLTKLTSSNDNNNNNNNNTNQADHSHHQQHQNNVVSTARTANSDTTMTSSVMKRRAHEEQHRRNSISSDQNYESSSSNNNIHRDVDPRIEAMNRLILLAQPTALEAVFVASSQWLLAIQRAEGGTNERNIAYWHRYQTLLATKIQHEARVRLIDSSILSQLFTTSTNSGESESERRNRQRKTRRRGSSPENNSNNARAMSLVRPAAMLLPEDSDEWGVTEVRKMRDVAEQLLENKRLEDVLHVQENILGVFLKLLVAKPSSDRDGASPAGGSPHTIGLSHANSFASSSYFYSVHSSQAILANNNQSSSNNNYSSGGLGSTIAHLIQSTSIVCLFRQLATLNLTYGNGHSAENYCKKYASLAKILLNGRDDNPAQGSVTMFLGQYEYLCSKLEARRALALSNSEMLSRDVFSGVRHNAISKAEHTSRKFIESAFELMDEAVKKQKFGKVLIGLAGDEMSMYYRVAAASAEIGLREGEAVQHAEAALKAATEVMRIPPTRVEGNSDCGVGSAVSAASRVARCFDQVPAFLLHIAEGQYDEATKMLEKEPFLAYCGFCTENRFDTGSQIDPKDPNNKNAAASSLRTTWDVICNGRLAETITSAIHFPHPEYFHHLDLFVANLLPIDLARHHGMDWSGRLRRKRAQAQMIDSRTFSKKNNNNVVAPYPNASTTSGDGSTSNNRHEVIAANMGDTAVSLLPYQNVVDKRREQRRKQRERAGVYIHNDRDLDLDDSDGEGNSDNNKEVVRRNKNYNSSFLVDGDNEKTVTSLKSTLLQGEYDHYVSSKINPMSGSPLLDEQFHQQQQQSQNPTNIQNQVDRHVNIQNSEKYYQFERTSMQEQTESSVELLKLLVEERRGDLEEYLTGSAEDEITVAADAHKRQQHSQLSSSTSHKNSTVIGAHHEQKRTSTNILSAMGQMLSSEEEESSSLLSSNNNNDASRTQQQQHHHFHHNTITHDDDEDRNNQSNLPIVRLVDSNSNVFNGNNDYDSSQQMTMMFASGPIDQSQLLPHFSTTTHPNLDNDNDDDAEHNINDSITSMPKFNGVFSNNNNNDNGEFPAATSSPFAPPLAQRNMNFQENVYSDTHNNLMNNNMISPGITASPFFSRPDSTVPHTSSSSTAPIRTNSNNKKSSRAVNKNTASPAVASVYETLRKLEEEQEEESFTTTGGGGNISQSPSGINSGLRHHSRKSNNNFQSGSSLVLDPYHHNQNVPPSHQSSFAHHNNDSRNRTPLAKPLLRNNTNNVSFLENPHNEDGDSVLDDHTHILANKANSRNQSALLSSSSYNISNNSHSNSKKISNNSSSSLGGGAGRENETNDHHQNNRSRQNSGNHENNNNNNNNNSESSSHHHNHHRRNSLSSFLTTVPAYLFPLNMLLLTVKPFDGEGLKFLETLIGTGISMTCCSPHDMRTALHVCFDRRIHLFAERLLRTPNMDVEFNSEMVLQSHREGLSTRAIIKQVPNPRFAPLFYIRQHPELIESVLATHADPQNLFRRYLKFFLFKSDTDLMRKLGRYKGEDGANDDFLEMATNHHRKGSEGGSKSIALDRILRQKQEERNARRIKSSYQKKIEEEKSKNKKQQHSKQTENNKNNTSSSTSTTTTKLLLRAFFDPAIGLPPIRRLFIETLLIDETDSEEMFVIFQELADEDEADQKKYRDNAQNYSERERGEMILALLKKKISKQTSVCRMMSNHFLRQRSIEAIMLSRLAKEVLTTSFDQTIGLLTRVSNLVITRVCLEHLWDVCERTSLMKQRKKHTSVDLGYESERHLISYHNKHSNNNNNTHHQVPFVFKGNPRETGVDVLLVESSSSSYDDNHHDNNSGSYGDTNNNNHENVSAKYEVLFPVLELHSAAVAKAAHANAAHHRYRRRTSLLQNNTDQAQYDDQNNNHHRRRGSSASSRKTTNLHQHRAAQDPTFPLTSSEIVLLEKLFKTYRLTKRTGCAVLLLLLFPEMESLLPPTEYDPFRLESDAWKRENFNRYGKDILAEIVRAREEKQRERGVLPSSSKNNDGSTPSGITNADSSSSLLRSADEQTVIERLLNNASWLATVASPFVEDEKSLRLSEGNGEEEM